MLLFALAGGCAHSSAFRCPAEGGPPWVEVESDHFVVKTDASEAAAERAVRELEAMRMAQLAAWDGAFDPPGRLEVVVLRSPAELDEIVDPALRRSFTRVAGYYVPGARPRVVSGLLLDREAPSLVLPWFQREREESASALESSILAHELAHHLIGQVLLRQPPWLGEGLAQYLEVTRLGTWQGRPAAAVGMARWEAWAAERIPAANLFAWRRGVPGYYASSWLMVHWLVNRRGAAFAGYQQRLARAEEPAAAWKAEFPDLDPADGAAMALLDRELDAYLRAASYTSRRVMLPAVEPPLRRRQLPPPEVHALRAELFLTPLLPSRTFRPRVEEEIAASLREDPSGLPLALTLAEAGHREKALDLGRAAATARPDDWRGWAMLAAGAEGRDDLAAERLAALRRAAALLPDDAWALNEVAWGLLEAGASGEAFPLAARAARLAPGNASVLDTWGAILADVGRCPEALLAQRRAVDLLGELAAAEAAREIRDRLARIEAQCGAPVPASR
jgi:tetratricopeptide (TPR) repeat protein